MKTDYLNKLKMLLDKYQMSDNEKEDIINDYSDMYDNWTDYGMSDDQVEEKLGSPDTIIGELVEGYKRVGTPTTAQEKKNSKIIAITPFIALVTFFIIGFGFDGWVYGWLVFLLIPVTAIFLEMGKDPHKLTALMPFIALLAFFYIGFVHNLWHPGWMVFIVIPIIAILIEFKSIGFLNTFVALSPIAATAVYLYYGFNDNLWAQLWPIFMIVPALGVLNEKSFFKVSLWEVLILGGVAGFYYIGITYGEWGYAALAFVPLALYGLLQDGTDIMNMPRNYRFVVLGAIISYFVLSFITKDWGYFWLVFLAIPVYAIMHETNGNERTIAITPFIAVFLFYTLGYYFDLWAFSWLAFLIIPVTAIIKEG